jgi:hypothetical protein
MPAWNAAPLRASWHNVEPDQLPVPGNGVSGTKLDWQGTGVRHRQTGRAMVFCWSQQR